MRYRKVTPPQRVKDWRKHKVRSKFPLQTMVMNIPEGTIFTITSSGPAKHLDATPCECCGVIPRVISRLTKEAFPFNFDFVVEADEL